MKKTLLFIITSAILLTACTNVNSNIISKYQEEPKDYLSISYTTYNDNQGPQSGMTTNIMIYDIEKDNLEKLNSVAYTSQYPLGVYSKSDNKIYFSSKNEKTGNGDELFSMDLETNEKKQLTDDLFAINHIIPRRDNILVVAVKKGTRALRLVEYDKKTGTILYNNLEDDDTDVWSICLNIENENEFYTSTYSQAQGYENAEKQSKKELDRYYYPDNTLTRYKNDFSSKEKIFFFEREKILSISATDKYLLIYRDGDSSNYNSMEINRISLDTDEFEEVKIPDAKNISEVQLDRSNNGIYYLGSDENYENRGIYYYDLVTGKKKTIFIEEYGVGHINNFMLIGN
ncbi:MAG TPA: hypothetical protein GX707_17310 [Epulopiscium sp.]|nr:hypothetical protein [Candidatus Epulonipiscium sp.]